MNNLLKDSELINLIEHYNWHIKTTPDKTWIVTGINDIFVVEARTLRMALHNALDAQRKWSIG